MKLAFSKPTKTPDETDLIFKSFKDYGFHGLQLKPPQYQPYLDKPEAFLEKNRSCGGCASAVITGGGVDAESLNKIDQICRFARSVGTEMIVYCQGKPARPEVTKDDLKKFARILSDAGKKSRDQGIRLSLHHHFNQPVMYHEDFKIFFDYVSDGAVGLTIDTAHLVKSEVKDIPGLIREFGGVIDNFHLKDFRSGDWQLLGQGDLDFPAIFKAIRDIKYDGWLCVDEETGTEITEAMKISASFMKKMNEVLKSAFV
jgi:inosose dehydratase